MSDIKYSKFLLNVVIPAYSNTDSPVYLCNFLYQSKAIQATEYKEFRIKLSNTITHEIVTYARKFGYFAGDVTFNWIFNLLGKSDQEKREARLVWLKSLAASYAVRGK